MRLSNLNLTALSLFVIAMMRVYGKQIHFSCLSDSLVPMYTLLSLFHSSKKKKGVRSPIGGPNTVVGRIGHGPLLLQLSVFAGGVAAFAVCPLMLMRRLSLS